MDPIIFPIDGKAPRIHSSAFIAPGAVVCGDVEIGAEASVWYGCVLRGDSSRIVVGAGANIQDGSVIHTDAEEEGGTPALIGAGALVGHKCMLHGCTVEDGGFVGMAATMLDGSIVQSGAMLAAGAFLSPRKVVPTGELWAGTPAKKFRDMREGEDKAALIGSAHYVHEASVHRAALEEFAKQG